MRKAVLVVAVLGCGSNSPRSHVAPAGQSLTFATSMQGQAAGEVTIEIAADGTRTTSTIFRVRGTQEIVKTVLRLDEAGAPSSYVATGVDHFGQAIEERLTAGPELRWRSTTEQGQAAAGSGFYAPLADSVDVEAALARAVLRAPGHRVALLPSGEAWLEDQVTRSFGTWTLRRVAIAGLGFEPAIVWLDAQGELFAAVSAWSATVRTGAEALAPRLLADQQAWTTARAAQLAGTLAHHPPAAGLAITHARVFDAVNRRMREDQTVLVVGETIAAVGSPAIPAGAQVIDARGRTLIPGLWDMHVHLHDTDGALHLASGVTTVRDLGNDFDDLNARVARYRDGTELGPSVLRAGLIDGPSPHSAGIGVVVATADEARAAVARYADAGYVQVKLYNSLAPALVPVIAQAAHARGLRVSGHVPNTMNAAQAVEAGYDELQHTNFLFLRFLAGPADDTRTMLRVTRVAERGAELDLAGPEVTRFLDLLVAHHTVIDATLTVFHNMFTADPGELDPVYAAYAARLPSQVVRGTRAGGLAADAAHRARYRASFAAMQRLVKLAWDRKIPIDTGTDYYAGISLPHELELLVQAGIPAAEALAMATLGDARIMHAEREVGTIAAGQRADLVLLDGDPTRDIAAVRNTDAVICRGVVYDPGELYASVGMRPRGASVTPSPPAARIDGHDDRSGEVGRSASSR